MAFTRRELLAGATAIGAFNAMRLRTASALGQKQLGNFQIQTLSDGHMVLPMELMYPDVPSQERDAYMLDHGLSIDRLEPPCTLTLMRTDERVVLFDVGGGTNFMPTTGQLPDALDEIGLDPSEITDVVFTHAHPDHLWGLLDDFDELLMSDAKYHISEAEWVHWTDPELVNKVDEASMGMAVGTKRRLDLLQDEISLFQPDTEILPGVFAHDTSGHTPGHCSYELRNGNESILVLGDVFNHPLINFEHPEWPFARDEDIEKGIATRRRMLDILASDQMPVIGYHMPHPGFGRVERKGSAYAYVQE